MAKKENDPEEGRLLKIFTDEMLKMKDLLPGTKEYNKQLAKCEAASKALKDYQASRN